MANILESLFGTTTQNNTSTSAPWAAIQPTVLGAIQGATPLLGTQQRYYADSTAAPVSQYTMQGLQGVNRTAQQPSIAGQAANQLGNVYGQQLPFNQQQQQQAFGSVLGGGMTTQQGNTARNALSSQLYQGGPNVQQVGAQNIGYQGVSTPGQNPYLNSMFGQAANQIQSRLGSQFASGGRLNSGAHQRGYAEQLGNAANQIYGAEASRQADRNLQAMMANQQAGLTAGRANQDASIRAQMANQGAGLQGYGLGLQGRSQAQQAAGALLSDEQRRAQTQLSGLQQANQAQQARYGDILQAASMAPGLEQAQYTPYQQLLQAGQTDTGEQQRLIDADKARFDFQQQEPWQRVGNFLNLIGYGSTPYGTKTQPVTTNNAANTFGTIAQFLPFIGGLL